VRARPLLAWGVAVGVLSLLLVLAGTDTAQAGTFNPVLEISLESTEPETPTNFTLDFGIRDKKDVNFGGVVSFIPADFGIVRGDRIPIGEPVGELDALATLGLINSACNQVLPVHFDFLNATIDKSSTVSFEDLELEAEDTSAVGFGTRDFAEDKDGNGLLDAIDHWPEFIDRVVGDVQPFRRSAGIATVAGIPVLLQFLIFNPGTQFEFESKDFQELVPTDEALGFPTIVLLQNIGDPELVPEPGPITDFCTPLTSTNIGYGTIYDADLDGTPNDKDTCPYDPHPLMGTHDADFDFLHTQCDPNDVEDEEDPSQSGRNEDQDEDGIDNFADNCPLEPNEDQADTDEDGIGDACDRNPNEPDGELILSMLPQAGDYTFTVFTVGQRDADNDGIQNSMDTCPFEPNVGDPTLLASGDADQDGLDAACDPNDDPINRGSNLDEDGDGYLNRQDNCPLIPNGQADADVPGVGNQDDTDFDQIGDACDPNPDTPDGELIDTVLTAEIVIGGGGAGGRPTNCPDCQEPGQDSNPVVKEGPGPDTGDEDDSSNTTLFIIIGAVAAAVVVVGGGAGLLLLRRG
jgi:hypothetical protein